MDINNNDGADLSISLKGVRKDFGTHRAVDDVSVEIGTEEFFAIIGASGCGKSTLLRLIAGLEPLTGGEVALAGRTVSGPDQHLPPEERNVGFVFQSYALWPHLDVRGNVAFPAEMSGLSRREAARRSDAHLETVSLSEFAERKPADLSGGQRQRVALARCLAQGAGTILMDEPLANLDPHLRRSMEEELVAFHRQAGATTIFITHDQREAMAVADRMAVMSNGRFLQVGAPQEIYERPCSAEVAKFIGSGSLQKLDWIDGRAEISGVPVPIEGTGDQALIRPDDIALGAAGTGHFSGNIAGALYRGGRWEARVTVAGMAMPFEVASRTPLKTDEPVGLTITSGWALPR